MRKAAKIDESQPAKRAFRLTAWTPDERQVQGAFFEWARKYGVREFPELDWIFHVPNGGLRSAKTAGMLKGQGVRAGILDVCLPAPRKGFHALWLEFKKPGEGPSKEQAKFIAHLEREGYAAHVVSDAGKAIEIVREYLK